MKINEIIQEDIMPTHFSQMQGKQRKYHEFGPNTKTQSNYTDTTYDPATNTLDTDLEKTEMMPGHGPMGMRGHQGRRYTKKTGSSGQQHGTGHDRSWTSITQQKRSKPAQDWGEEVLDRGDSLHSSSDRSSDIRYTPGSYSTNRSASDHDVRDNRSATDTAKTTIWDPEKQKLVTHRIDPATISDFKVSSGSVGSDFTVRKASGAQASPEERLANRKRALAHAQANRGIDPRNQTI
ncbi:MAG: hypothetical protein CXT73_00775 [Methanobacteriota archaeon]|jgi:hypothetical protein|nr:MAG: hypothetical protein CXT73_00775 [Euryarchaeota archaeon]